MPHLPRATPVPPTPRVRPSRARLPRARLPQALIALGAVAAAGIALAGPVDLLRDLRQRYAERAHVTSKPISAPGTPTATDPRFSPRPRPKPQPSTGNMPALSEMQIDLTYLDPSRTAYTRFRNWVDSAVNGSPGYAYEARDSVLMYRISRDVKYCNHAVGLVEQQVAQAEAAIAAGQRPAIAADSYLEVGPMIADLAMTYDTCAARVTSSQRQRWSAYAQQAIWNVWNHQDARWGNTSHPWSGWSVNNPGNNYYFSFVEATMMWALATRNPTWMALLKTDKLPKLEAYYRNMPTGGSLEGTGYGTAQMRLFELYRIWRDATGIDLANANPHATSTIQWWVHGTVPTRTHFAPIGDQSRNSVPELYDYHRRLVLEARRLTNDPAAQRIASWWLNTISVQQMAQGANFRYDLLPPGSNGSAPTALHYHGSATGHLFARSSWDTTAMWMSYVAGPYNESHAHQDQGAFTLYARDWLAVTENIWSRSGIQQGTEVHNTMRFERSNTSTAQCTAPANDRIVHQCESPQSIATMTVTPGANGAITVDSDLTPVYRGNPALTRWTRNLQFANRRLTVRDNFILGSGTTAFFQVQVPVQPTVSGSTITAGNLRVRVLEPANATITLRNWNTVNASEFTKGWRIDIGGGTSTYLVELSEVTP